MAQFARTSTDLFWRPVCFAGVGLANTLVDFVILLALSRLFLWPTVLANMTSYSCGVFCSYVLNSRLTFGNRASSWRYPLVAYIFVNALGLLTNSVIVVTTAQSIGLVPAKLYATLASFIVNYILSRFLVFSTEKGPRK